MSGERSLWRYLLRSLWGPFVVVMAVSALWSAYRWVPLVQVQAMCQEYKLGPPYEPIAGRLSHEFQDALRKALSRVPYLAYGDNTLIPLWEALDGERVGSASDDAVWALVERRTGVRRGDLWRGVRVAGFDNLGWPTCEATQAIAIWNGVWAREGPAPIWRRPSPGIEAPDYAREGDLPPVEQWGFDIRHQFELSRWDFSSHRPRPGDIRGSSGGGLEARRAAATLSPLGRLSRIRADLGGHGPAGDPLVRHAAGQVDGPAKRGAGRVSGERRLWRYVLRSLWGPLLVILAVSALWSVYRWVPMVELQAMCQDERGPPLPTDRWRALVRIQGGLA